jgi:hypothetical protein
MMDWPSRRISLFQIFAVATAFGIFSGLQAYNYITLFTDRKQPFHILLALNVTYWYAWAVLVPGILWMAWRYPFGRHTWKRAAAVHVGSVVVFTFAHAVLTVTCRVLIMKAFADRDVSWWMYFQELFFLNFDWEMMTYWAVVGFSHALDFHRESQERELTAAQLRTRLVEANLQALQRQLHPHFLFNTLNTISALMHRDTRVAPGRARLPAHVSRDREDPLRRAPAGPHRDRSRDARCRRAEPRTAAAGRECAAPRHRSEDRRRASRHHRAARGR